MAVHARPSRVQRGRSHLRCAAESERRRDLEITVEGAFENSGSSSRASTHDLIACRSWLLVRPKGCSAQSQSTGLRGLQVVVVTTVASVRSSETPRPGLRKRPRRSITCRDCCPGYWWIRSTCGVGRRCDVRRRQRVRISRAPWLRARHLSYVLPISLQYSRARRKQPAITRIRSTCTCARARMSGTGSLPTARTKHRSLSSRVGSTPLATAVNDGEACPLRSGSAADSPRRKHPRVCRPRANALGLAARVRDDRRGSARGGVRRRAAEYPKTPSLSRSRGDIHRTLLRSTSSSSRRSLTGRPLVVLEALLGVPVIASRVGAYPARS